jgi:hypothetical protein
MRRTTIGGMTGVAVCLWTALASAAPRAQPAAIACREVPEAESHLAVLLSPDDVLSVEALTARGHFDDPSVPFGEGARIVVAAQPFVTSTWLRAVIDCHLARIASAREPGAGRSPLDVAGATVTVTDAPGTFEIDITTDDHRAAREIFARAHALLPSR